MNSAPSSDTAAAYRPRDAPDPLSEFNVVNAYRLPIVEPASLQREVGAEKPFCNGFANALAVRPD